MSDATFDPEFPIYWPRDPGLYEIRAYPVSQGFSAYEVRPDGSWRYHRKGKSGPIGGLVGPWMAKLGPFRRVKPTEITLTRSELVQVARRMSAIMQEPLATEVAEHWADTIIAEHAAAHQKEEK